MSADAASLPCPLCAHTSVFETVQTLRDRLIYVSTNNILCPVCQEEVSGLDKLTIHLFSHVKTIQMKKCEELEKKSDLQNSTVADIQNVSTTHTKKARTTSKNKPNSMTAAAPVKYVKIYPKLPTVSMNTVSIIGMSHCTSSEETGKSLPTLKKETLVQTNTICDVCGLQFVNADILKMHRCLIHNIDDKSNENFTRYQCHLCPKNFKMRGSLMVHLRVAHFGFLSGYSNEVKSDKEAQNETINDQNIDDKVLLLQRNDNKQWQCDVCRKCFTTKYFLKKHKRLHTGETPYSCAQCNKTFTFQQSYHKHLLYHNDEKPHTCNFCGRAFKELSTLHNHQRIHTGEKPFSCETCGKCFRQRVSYLVHRRIHTGAMPYKCTACEKSFRYKVSQRTHKCPSKPPGTVIRQSGELVEKLKKKQITEETSLENIAFSSSANYHEVSESNAELVLTSAKLSLEDMESENFTLISEPCINSDENPKHSEEASCSTHLASCNDIDTKNSEIIDSNFVALMDAIPTTDKSIPSPSEILKNLCLSKEEDYLGILDEPVNDKNYDLYKDFGEFM